MKSTHWIGFTVAALLTGLVGCIDMGAILGGSTGPAGPTGETGPAGPPGDPGTGGPAGPGYMPMEPGGVVGYVRDTTAEAVAGARVYLVPTADIPTDALALTDVAVERTSEVDEPLEDTVAKNGAGYVQATTDATGVYRIDSVPEGTYFIVVMPEGGSHLPGGSRCRTALAQADLVGQQIDIEISTKPSSAAKYVGPTVCITCHGLVHEYETLHYLGLRKIGEIGNLQDQARFPDWNLPLAKFTPAGTTLYFYAYNGNSASPDWKVSETNPGSGVSFTARLYTASDRYYVDLTDVKGAAGTVTYEVEMSYGGGLYKQRYVTPIGGSRYVLPIQFNFQGQTDETQPFSRWVWQQYNAQNWYTESSPALKTPPKTKAFDNNCAGCHFTGFSLTGDSTNGFKAHAVPDVNGEMDFDGDGRMEAINITCESCHGPGSEHWERAGGGHAIVAPQLLTPEREVAICSQCHTRALGVGGASTETPMDSSGRMMRAGESRKEFLTNFVSKLDDGLWDANKGDGKHSKKHHQQASDFIKTKKYRNDTNLMTCASCHDPHGKGDQSHQVLDRLDRADSGEGLCLSCHSDTLPAGPTLASRQTAHYASKGIPGIDMGNIGCTDCHMTKTAKSGAGLKQATINGMTFYSGDISSHLFDVPSPDSIATKAADMMPVPYTNACAACHIYLGL